MQAVNQKAAGSHYRYMCSIKFFTHYITSAMFTIMTFMLSSQYCIICYILKSSDALVILSIFNYNCIVAHARKRLIQALETVSHYPLQVLYIMHVNFTNFSICKSLVQLYTPYCYCSYIGILYLLLYSTSAEGLQDSWSYSLF